MRRQSVIWRVAILTVVGVSGLMLARLLLTDLSNPNKPTSTLSGQAVPAAAPINTAAATPGTRPIVTAVDLHARLQETQGQLKEDSLSPHPQA